MIDDELRTKMLESYYGGGVSTVQVHELGHTRPSISAFLDFSEKYEGVPFRAISDFGSLEFVFAYEGHFKKIGISGLMLATCMDGDEDTIRSVCREILKSINNARRLEQYGETQLASRGGVINPTAVKAFILAVLDARERYQYCEVIPELYFLISTVLFPGEPDVEKTRKNSDMKAWVELLAWAYHHKHGCYPSYRQLAKLLRVAPSTISRLFKSKEDFEAQTSCVSIFHIDPSEHPALIDIYPHL